MPKPVTIAGIEFPSQAAAESHASAILEATPFRGTVDPVHYPFLTALLMARSEKVQEVAGRKVVGFVRDRQPHSYSHRRWTDNFYAVFEKDGRLDFSFGASIKALADQQVLGSKSGR